MATMQKRHKEAARAERRQQKFQKRLERKNEESKGPQIESVEPMPELTLEIRPDGTLVGLERPDRKSLGE